MARQNTSIFQRSPARKRSSFSHSPKTLFKPLDRSFADNRTYNRGPKGRPLSSYNRFGQATGNLSNIREESVELEGGSRLRDEVYRDFHTNTFQDNEYDDTEDEDDMADWDEESTLVAMLHDELSETKEDRLSALVNNLKTPINAYGLTLKQHLVQTFIPTAKQLKATHTAMESKVDIPFESGLLLFNDATRKLEDLVIREEDELRVAYGETQNNLKKLFAQLEQAYARRNQIYSEFEVSLNQSVQNAKADLNTLPGDIERTITALDKKSKDIEKNDGVSAKTKEKMLREFLNKF